MGRGRNNFTEEIYPRKSPKHGSYIEEGIDVSLSHMHPYSGKAVEYLVMVN